MYQGAYPIPFPTRPELVQPIRHFSPTTQLSHTAQLQPSNIYTIPFPTRERKPIKIIDPTTGTQIISDKQSSISIESPIKNNSLIIQPNLSSNLPKENNGDAIREEF
ncbi:hypothetical protein, partial [Salmonella sp. s51228]|uniref:hypothetical protein n=1 Tax=Salmonella sp. s51228 TaxID=3159652 RepID=UPI00397F19BA